MGEGIKGYGWVYLDCTHTHTLVYSLFQTLMLRIKLCAVHDHSAGDDIDTIREKQRRKNNNSEEITNGMRLTRAIGHLQRNLKSQEEVKKKGEK